MKKVELEAKGSNQELTCSGKGLVNDRFDSVEIHILNWRFHTLIALLLSVPWSTAAGRLTIGHRAQATTC